MYLIRKISPWQDQNKVYSFGNPAIELCRTIEEAQIRKNLLEVEELKKIGITNNYEYWEVDNTVEMEELNQFSIDNYNIQILEDNRDRECHNIQDIIPTDFPNNFSFDDYLRVQQKNSTVQL